jgi:zinc protease
MVRARKPMLEGLLQARETNSYWLSALSGVQADPRQLDALRSLIPTLEAVTPDDLNAAARRWMGEERLWRMEIRPEVAAGARSR